MRALKFFCVMALTASPLCLLGAAPGLPPDAPAKFSVSTQTEIPGLTLQPGAYTIRIMDHYADRVIVRVEGRGDVHSTFIALPNVGIGTPDSSGLINWRNSPSGLAATRGFSFPGGIEVEFVYPKAEAVTLAKLNANKVPAIDPASEGRVADQAGLSKDDMQLVTLWMLAENKVGPSDTAPAITAERYQQVASVSHKPVIARLPHTAGSLYLVALLGMLSLVSAGVLRVARYRFARRP